ncbi:hypothetical protein POM88_007506 [Heracleum sosnowskyi]|uniref:Uncharacterized protein n=1 Tax=Heracleum sosnowskyi TaxID=360622 RepID=A0AAD8J5J1_9APIA|nr:hypothetical protein POM88_007506 [Heracleum sosnowskyi]
MRGRLRLVRDTVKELDDEKSKLEAGAGRGNITDFGLPSGKELPDYDGNVNEVVEEDTEDEEEKQSFHGDSSNMDSSESDCPKPKKKVRRIPPPNPPYRARKRGRYSMPRDLFKNTEDTPVAIDEDDEMKMMR